MSVYSVTPKFGSLAGDSSPVKSFGVLPRRDLLFDVVHDVGDADDAILASELVAQPRSLLQSGSSLSVVDRQLRRVYPALSALQVTYGSPVLSALNNNDPLAAPIEISYRLERITDICDVDQQGQAICAITGERFEPQPTERYFFPIMRIVGNVSYDPGPLMEQYFTPLPATNSDVYRGRPPGSLIVWDSSASYVPGDEISYWRWMIEVAYRGAAPGSTAAKAWWMRIPAMGYLEIDQDTNKAVPIEFNGKEVMRPWPHDKDTGEKLDWDADRQFYEFQTMPSLPFSALL